MDEQVKNFLDFLKGFRDNNKLTDEEFVEQLGQGIVDGERDDPCLSDTLQDFRDLMRMVGKKVDGILLERHLRS
jgi:hypothetical protein